MKRVAVAKMLLLDEKNRALMLRRSEYREHPEKSHTPDLPGGLVDPGESEHQAVVRELQEEAGITIDPNDVLLGYAETKFYEPKQESVSKLFYVARVAGTPEVTVSWEHESYEWCPIDSFLQTYEFSPFYAEAITYLIEHNLL